ncbi:PREDICTED: aminopeptidase N-like, partial [Wasmannia auropunctata]|uniref:aminopeptidase N-like n=1 Tax=Wasmannia auropunctata TaxID=64793 RepID=UPI0005F0815F
MEQGLGQPDALWEAIKAQVNNEEVDPNLNIDVKSVMDTWTTQAGYPIVTVDVNDNGILSITQKRFLLRNLDNIATDNIWSVPLTFTIKSQADFTNLIPKYWLSNEESTASYNIDPNEWVIFNLQSSGFYRVNYNNRGWKNILDALKNDDLDNIHVLNRAAIVDDLLNLGRAGYLDYVTVYDGLRYLSKETHYLPFKAAFNGLEFLNKRFTGSLERSLFKAYVKSLIENIHLQLKYDDNENDGRLKILLRRDVNNWLCKLDNIECVTTYTEKFKEWRTNPAAKIEPNARSTAYCTAMRHGTSDDWEYLWQEYFDSNYPTDQMVILNALGCSQNTTILEEYLKYAIAGYETSRIRKQDSKTVFEAVYNSGLLGAEYILDFVDKYHKDMEEYYGEQNTIATILDGTSQCLTTAESINKFERLINNHKDDFTSIQKSLERSLKIAQYELERF